MIDKTETLAKIRTWAVAQVAIAPTRIEDAGYKDGQTIYRTVYNTVEHELRLILSRHMFQQYEQYKKHELLDIINELMWGTTTQKPLNSMTELELLESIWSEIVEELIEDDQDLTAEERAETGELTSDDILDDTELFEPASKYPKR